MTIGSKGALVPWLFLAGLVPSSALLHAYHENLAWRVVTASAIWALGISYGEWHHHHDHCAEKRHLLDRESR